MIFINVTSRNRNVKFYTHRYFGLQSGNTKGVKFNCPAKIRCDLETLRHNLFTTGVMF